MQRPPPATAWFYASLPQASSRPQVGLRQQTSPFPLQPPSAWSATPQAPASATEAFSFATPAPSSITDGLVSMTDIVATSERSPAGPAPLRNRTRVANSCKRCKSKKIRCSREAPCAACTKAGTLCDWTDGHAPITLSEQQGERIADVLSRRLRRLSGSLEHLQSPVPVAIGPMPAQVYSPYHPPPVEQPTSVQTGPSSGLSPTAPTTTPRLVSSTSTPATERSLELSGAAFGAMGGRWASRGGDTRAEVGSVGVAGTASFPALASFHATTSQAMSWSALPHTTFAESDFVPFDWSTVEGVPDSSLDFGLTYQPMFSSMTGIADSALYPGLHSTPSSGRSSLDAVRGPSSYHPSPQSVLPPTSNDPHDFVTLLNALHRH